MLVKDKDIVLNNGGTTSDGIGILFEKNAI